MLTDDQRRKLEVEVLVRTIRLARGFGGFDQAGIADPTLLAVLAEAKRQDANPMPIGAERALLQVDREALR